MTMNLITGKAGAPHITSSDQGAMQAGLVGNGNYLLQGGDGKFPAVTMQSANKALVPVLNLVIEGHMMLQIGVDVLPEYRRLGVASAVTSRLAMLILDQGKVPFYCSAWSNIRSVRNAVKCGFIPAWVELTVKPE